MGAYKRPDSFLSTICALAYDILPLKCTHITTYNVQVKGNYMNYSLRLNHLLLAVLLCLGKPAFGEAVSAYTQRSLESEVAFYTTQDHFSLKAAILESITQAQKSILIFAFTLSDKDIIEALTKKAEAGLEVTVIIDKNHIDSVMSTEDIEDYGKRDTGIQSLTRENRYLIGKKDSGMQVLTRVDGEGDCIINF